MKKKIVSSNEADTMPGPAQKKLLPPRSFSFQRKKKRVKETLKIAGVMASGTLASLF